MREVLEAAFGYVRTTGRRLSIEYALIRDVNDQPWRADLLAKRLRGKLVHVNLIPLNPTPGSEWDASPKPERTPSPISNTSQSPLRRKLGYQPSGSRIVRNRSASGP